MEPIAKTDEVKIEPLAKEDMQRLADAIVEALRYASPKAYISDNPQIGVKSIDGQFDMRRVAKKLLLSLRGRL